jgi:hypothetical protein
MSESILHLHNQFWFNGTKHTFRYAVFFFLKKKKTGELGQEVFTRVRHTSMFIKSIEPSYIELCV